MTLMRSGFGVLFAACVCLSSNHGVTLAEVRNVPATNQASQVRMIYLVPSDREPQPDYVAAIERGIRSVQIFYRNQLGNGMTFHLHTPVVEVYKTSHPASYYATSIWSRALEDGFKVTHGRFDDPHNRWVFYIDADPDCHNGGTFGGTQGVALLPKNDLRGLSGVKAVHICPNDGFSDHDNLCRWIGGLGHELGHAFGLPHPAACDKQIPGAPCPAQALMWTGYTTYPGTFLLPEDKRSLGASGFFSVVSLPGELPSCKPL